MQIDSLLANGTTQGHRRSSSYKRSTSEEDIGADNGNKRAALEDPSESKSVTLSVKPCVDKEYRMKLSDDYKTVKLSVNALYDNFTFSRALSEHFPEAKHLHVHIHLKHFLHTEDKLQLADTNDVRDSLKMLLKVRDKYTFGFRFITVKDMEVTGAMNEHNASKFQIIAWFYELAKGGPPLSVDLCY